MKKRNKCIIAVAIIFVLIVFLLLSVRFLPVSSIYTGTVSKGDRVDVVVYHSELDKSSVHELNQKDADKIIELINSKNSLAINRIPSFDYPACMFDESLYLKINDDAYYMSVCCRDKIYKNSLDDYFYVESTVIDDIYSILADNGFESAYEES